MTELPAVEHEQNGTRGAFTVSREGERLAELTYQAEDEGRIVVEHTEVSETLKGRGVGKKLVAAAVDWARSKNVKIVPVCSFTKSVLERTPEFQDVVANQTQD